MWKTGWVMEWENEVRYAAPFRCRANALTLAFKPLSLAYQQFQKSVNEAARAFAKLNEEAK